MTIAIDTTVGNQAADRAQAYVALLGQIIPELEPQTFGRCLEQWAWFMLASRTPKSACVAALRFFRDGCPVTSLARACATLEIDVRDVLNDEVAA